LSLFMKRKRRPIQRGGFLLRAISGALRAVVAAHTHGRRAWVAEDWICDGSER
jgi:hypothetical protein